MRVSTYDQAEDFYAIDGTNVREIVGTSSLFSTNQSLSEATVPVGISTTEHFHRTSEEVYFIRAGRGRVRVGDEYGEVSTGSCVIIPSGSIHNITNIGEVPLRMYCCCSPPYRDDDTVVVGR